MLMAGGARKGAGRKPIPTTDKDRAVVKAMSAFGASPKDIGAVIGMSERSVQRKFRGELRTGYIEANAKVARTIYEQAIAGNMTAAIFWAKCRMGWRDVNRTEITGENGGPIRNVDVTKLSDEELRAIVAGDAGPKDQSSRTTRAKAAKEN
jgi:hypothetical protein